MQLYIGTYFWEEKLILAKVNIIKDFCTKSALVEVNDTMRVHSLLSISTPPCNYQRHLLYFECVFTKTCAVTQPSVRKPS